MLINHANLKTLYIAFKAAFQGALGQAESQYLQIATVVPSSTGTEEYGWLGAIPNVREWVGDRVVHGIQSHGYSIKNKTFELTVAVPRESIEDDTYGLYTPMMSEMGTSVGAHGDQLAFGLLKAGRGTNSYDGVPFFSASHPVIDDKGKPATQSNVDDSGGGQVYWYVLDLSRSIKPIVFQDRKQPNFVARTNETDDNVFSRREFEYGVDMRRNVGFGLWQLAQSSNKALDKANLKAAITALSGRKGDHGRPLGLKATHLVVPSSLEFEARELLENERDAAGATNVMRGRLQLMVAPWLD